VNAPNTDRYHSVEGTLTKRFSRRWTGQGVVLRGEDHRWIASVFQSPNDEFFPLDETWSWAGNVTGSYRMPGDVSISGFLQTKNGYNRAAHLHFPPGRPDGGAAIVQNGNTMLRVEPYGSQRLSAQKYSEPQGQQGSQTRRRAAAQYRRVTSSTC